MDEAEDAMRASTLDRRFVPLRETAPKYEVARLRAEARAGELARGRAADDSREGEATTSPYGYELWVQSDDGSIGGRIDRARPTIEGTVLQDYKSGAIFSLQEGDRREIKPEYALQLRMYAALYHEATGTWPIRLELVPLSGTPQQVSFSQTECLNLLDTTKAVLREVNAELARTDGWDRVEASLATPSAAACRFCSFRPACAAYLAEEEGQRRDRAWPADVWGAFQSLTRLGNGRLILRAKREDGSSVFVRDLSDEVANETLRDIAEDTLVGAFNLRRTRSPDAFESKPLTTIYCHSEA